MYLRAKYGLFKGTALETPPVQSASEAFVLSQKALELYPHNYYFPSWAAMVALREVRSARSRTEVDAALSAAFWCAREAVSLNPYYAEARYAWGEALVESGRVPEAVEFWRSTIDREFWNPDNHEHYVRTLLRAGSAEARAEAVREAPMIGDPALRRRLARMRAEAGKRKKNKSK